MNHIRTIEVFKRFNGVSPPDFEKYFGRLDHSKGTRGNDHSLLLPKVKSVAGRKTFPFLGAKIFPKLPNSIED